MQHAQSTLDFQKFQALIQGLFTDERQKCIHKNMFEDLATKVNPSESGEIIPFVIPSDEADQIKDLFLAPIMVALKHTENKLSKKVDVQIKISGILERCRNKLAPTVDETLTLAALRDFAVEELKVEFPHAESKPVRIFLDVLMLLLPLLFVVKKAATGTWTFGSGFGMFKPREESSKALGAINEIDALMPLATTPPV